MNKQANYEAAGVVGLCVFTYGLFLKCGLAIALMFAGGWLMLACLVGIGKEKS